MSIIYTTYYIIVLLIDGSTWSVARKWSQTGPGGKKLRQMATADLNKRLALVKKNPIKKCASANELLPSTRNTMYYIQVECRTLHTLITAISSTRTHYQLTILSVINI